MILCFSLVQVAHPSSPHRKITQKPAKAGLHSEACGGDSQTSGCQGGWKGQSYVIQQPAPASLLVVGNGSPVTSLHLCWGSGWGSIYPSSAIKEGAPCFAG